MVIRQTDDHLRRMPNACGDDLKYVGGEDIERERREKEREREREKGREKETERESARQAGIQTDRTKRGERK